MAPKRQLPAENPPPAFSDEESEDEEEEEEEEQESGESKSGSESDDEDDNKGEQKKPSQPKPSSPPPPPTTKPPQKSEGGSSSDEWETESESEAKPESESRRYTVKSIASKPMETVETPPAKKQKPEPTPSSKQKPEPSPSSKQPAAKRKVEEEDSKKGGKKKDDAENGSLQKPGEELKKPTFQRIWGGNDVIALLQGMIEFREKKGLDPSANTTAFHHFVKKSLGHEFTDNQLGNKMRLLKKKYKTNEWKGKDGEVRVFSKPHEQKVFKLSKKIWGASKNNETGGSGDQTPVPKVNDTSKKGKTGGTKSKTKSEVSVLEPAQSSQRPKENGLLIPFEHSEPVSMLSCDKMLQLSRIGLDEDFLKKGWEMVGESKREELKERWEKLQLAEMRVLVERTGLIQYQINLILEACH